MRLARDYRWTKDKLLREMTSSEIADWIAFFNVTGRADSERESREKGMVLQEKFKAFVGGKIAKKKKG